MTELREWKLCIIGEMGVGKTSILMRYKNKAFCNGYTTIGAAYSTVRLTVDSITHKLIVWDTAGQERFRSLAPIYYRGIRAAVLVFSVTDRESFRNIVDYWMPAIKDHAMKDKRHIVTCIVGNKADLEGTRKITSDEAIAFAIESDSTYFETSAKTGDNVDQLFLAIARQVTLEMEKELENESASPSLIHVPEQTDEESSGLGQINCC